MQRLTLAASVLLSGAVLMGASSVARAATYYVSKTASNGYAVGKAANSCVHAQSKSTPQFTISAAVDCMSGGDTIVVNEGTYTEEVNSPPSGSEAAYTIIKADPISARPIIDPDGVNLERAFFCAGQGCHHIRFEGFEVVTAFNHLSLQGTPETGYPHHIQIVNNVMHDSIHTGMTIGGSNHLFQGNEFYNTGSRYTDKPENTNPYGPRHNTIYGLGDNTVVEHNVFHDLANGVAVWASGSIQKDNIIRHNVFYNIGREDLNPWLAGPSGSYAAIHLSVPGGNHRVHNNVIYNSGTPGNAKFSAIRVGTQATGDLGDIVNNTIHNLYCGGTCWGILIKTGVTAEVRNNICWGSCPNAFSGGTQSNNLTTDPLFKNASGADFLLLPGSDAIDSGIDVGLPFVGTAPDIGALEFDADSPPASPTGLSVQ